MMDHVACWRYSESSAYPLCMSDWSVCFWKINCLTEVVLTAGKGIFGHKLLEWLYRMQTEMQYCWHCDKWILKTQVWVWASLPSPHPGHHLGGPSSESARTTKHQLAGSSWGLRSHLLPERALPAPDYICYGFAYASLEHLLALRLPDFFENEA